MAEDADQRAKMAEKRAQEAEARLLEIAAERAREAPAVGKTTLAATMETPARFVFMPTGRGSFAVVDRQTIDSVTQKPAQVGFVRRGPDGTFTLRAYERGVADQGPLAAFSGRKVDPTRPLDGQLAGTPKTERQARTETSATATVAVVGIEMRLHPRSTAEFKAAREAYVKSASDEQLLADRETTRRAWAETKARCDVQDTYRLETLEGGLKLVDGTLKERGLLAEPSSREKPDRKER